MDVGNKKRGGAGGQMGVGLDQRAIPNDHVLASNVGNCRQASPDLPAFASAPPCEQLKVRSIPSPARRRRPYPSHHPRYQHFLPHPPRALQMFFPSRPLMIIKPNHLLLSPDLSSFSQHPICLHRGQNTTPQGGGCG